MYKVFIDGEHGTTGLHIHQHLKTFENIKILSLPPHEYKNIHARVDIAKQADITILCLPDEAAKEIVNKLYKEKNIRIIDCSTAFRTDKYWVYGFAELTSNQEKLIQNAKYVSNPGCYPTGALSLIRPLRDRNVFTENAFLTIYAVSGYSGGGKNLINQMTNTNAVDYIESNYFSYALQLEHKHNSEIKKHGKLKNMPVFLPNVAQFKQGMIVNIGIHLDSLNGKYNIEDINEIFVNHYKGKDNILIADYNEAQNTKRLEPELFTDANKLKIYIFGSEENRTINLCAIFDNLGKGASGAAIQNLKHMLHT